MDIFNKLVDLQKNCYSVYSNYPVSCIVKDVDNNYYYGVNVENASFGLTICAERSAIVSAITHGARKIVEVHILCSDKKSFGTPCGMCRQTIAEFMDDDGEIWTYNILGESKKFVLKELLPGMFRNNFFNKE